MKESSHPFKISIVGAGIFGAASALELGRRGHHVTLFDPGPIPHPDAASTDISKAIRIDYGADEFYMALMEKAVAGWEKWNEAWDEPLYHPTGVNLLSRGPMVPGGFEHDSYQNLLKRGHAPQRMDASALKERFPAFDAERYPDGYYNPVGGWAESGKVVVKLIRMAEAEGVALAEGVGFSRLIETAGRVEGFVDAAGQPHMSDYVIIAAGAWTPVLFPELKDRMWPVAQPVFHFKVEDVTQFQPPHFVVWTGDVARTGWYGFPAKPDGTLKIANHGAGWDLLPGGGDSMPPEAEPKFRAFLRDTFPEIAAAPVLKTRLCFYCDTWDGDLWIDHDPDRPGLFLATGGSGHGFKFAPVLGEIVADTVEGRANPSKFRFRWRRSGGRRSEDARYLG